MLGVSHSDLHREPVSLLDLRTLHLRLDEDHGLKRWNGMVGVGT